MKKALVLAGGYPQISLIKKLNEKNIYTILADYLDKPLAKEYANEFHQISTLDADAIKKLAIECKVDFLITVCTDQALVTLGKVSEELGLPSYIDYNMAKCVTNKRMMKEVLRSNGINTAEYRIVSNYEESLSEMEIPLIVKPVDCNSSKGVRKVFDEKSFKYALEKAIEYSRTNTAIVEQFVLGEEYSIDAVINNGKAIILDITQSEKIESEDKFIISRTWHKREFSDRLHNEIENLTQRIVMAFGIKNGPMLIQCIETDNGISVLELSVRTGGGIKHISIKDQTGVDIIDYVINLTLEGYCEIPLINARPDNIVLDEYLYCEDGKFCGIIGFEELKQEGIIHDYYVFKNIGDSIGGTRSSGDRVAGITIKADSQKELDTKHKIVNGKIGILSDDGHDILRHDLLRYTKR